MGTSRRCPGLEKAWRFLAEQGLPLSGSPKRVSLRELARRADVSYVTMWKAAHQQGGPLTRSVSSVVTGKAARWLATFDALVSDFRQGRFPPGSLLPKSDLLVERYGVSHPTLRRALGLAVSEGLVAVHKRTYRVHELSRGEPYGTVCIVARQAPEGEAHTSSYYAYIRAAEQTCARASVRPRIISVDIDGSWRRVSAEDRALLEGLRGRPDVFGALLIDRGLAPEVTIPLVERFTRQGKPVAIMAERGDLVLPPNLAASPLVRHYTYSNSALAGHAMGRYLASLGHRRVAYLAAWEDPAWSANRLAGLRQALAVHAAGGEVVVQPSYGPMLATTAMHLRTEAEALLRTVEGRDLAGSASQVLRLAPALGESARALAQAVSAAPSAGPAAAAFERLLAGRAVTAWAGANDDMALDALRFLSSRGVAVPADISVVGFDDTEEAFLQHLTSYNFNAPGVMQAMLDHVLRYGRSGRPSAAPGPLEIEGYISQRGSSGRRGRAG